MPMTPGVRHQRAKIAALSRSRTEDDPELVAARRQLRFEKYAQDIEKVVSQAPPMTGEQMHRIAAILANAPVETLGGEQNSGGEAA